MEEFAIDLRNPAVAPLQSDLIERPRLSLRERMSAYVELTKPRITFLIVLTSAAGFALASQGSIDALLYLSNAYEYGVLTDRDPVKALAYYRAVELSDTNAVSQRALAYLQQNLSPTQLLNAEQQARSIHANCCE